jgi:hypothetical protein
LRNLAAYQQRNPVEAGVQGIYDFINSRWKTVGAGTKKGSTVETADLNDCLPYEKVQNSWLVAFA